MTSLISSYINPVEAYLKQSSTMIPLIGATSYRGGPVYTVSRRKVKGQRRRRRKSRKIRRGKVRRNPKTGRFMKSK